MLYLIVGQDIYYDIILVRGCLSLKYLWGKTKQNLYTGAIVDSEKKNLDFQRNLPIFLWATLVIPVVQSRARIFKSLSRLKWKFNCIHSFKQSNIQPPLSKAQPCWVKYYKLGLTVSHLQHMSATLTFIHIMGEQ